MALGRCLRRRWNGVSYSTVCADLCTAHAKGNDALHQCIQRHRINEAYVWVRPPRGWNWSQDAPPEAYQYPPPQQGGW